MRPQDYIIIFIGFFSIIAATIFGISQGPVHRERVSAELESKQPETEMKASADEDEKEGYVERQFKRNIIRKTTGIDIYPFEPNPLKHLFP